MFTRFTPEQLEGRGLDSRTAAGASRMIAELEANGFPMIDDLIGLDLGRPEERLDQAKQAFNSLKPGLTHFIIHPSVDTPELREIARDWRARVADYETFMREDLRAYILDIGVHVIGYKTLRNLIRAV
jgi:chitin disaccharide deacetylase